MLLIYSRVALGCALRRRAVCCYAPFNAIRYDAAECDAMRTTTYERNLKQEQVKLGLA